MRPLHLLALASVLIGPALAQNATPGGPRNNFTRANGGGVMPNRGGHFHGGLNTGFPLWVEERVVVVEKEVPVPSEVTPPLAPSHRREAKSEEPRKPYVIGASYASLPGGCMKMVEASGSFFYCNGDWYKQTGPSYRAVREP